MSPRARPNKQATENYTYLRQPTKQKGEATENFQDEILIQAKAPI